ncbi:MAG: hypothetical protein PSN34_15795 [Urechidicola sp.]|nr:hypothetical protein [Urechidicola sp.]
MKKIATTLLLIFICFQAYSQKKNDDYEFGKITQSELEMTTYEKDTTANAVVLYEHGYTDFSVTNSRYIIRTTVYKKVKIFNNDGYDNATIEVYLYKGERAIEKLRNIKGLSHNIAMKSMKINKKDIFETEVSDRVRKVSFTLPNIKDGTVIEYMYTIESPFFHNFTGWDFQEEIPKVESTFKASIPGNFVYNRSIIGSLRLNENTAVIKKKCFSIPGVVGYSDCEDLTYTMKDIPAFIEEDYMTSAKNFKSRIKFEMSKYQSFSGEITKYTSTWKSVDKDYKRDKDIGGQLMRKDYFKKIISDEILSERDILERAKKVYYFIRNHYSWNEDYKIFSDMNVKRAFKNKVGSVGEVNISLINALDASGIDAEMVLLSTRGNGTPTKIHPVITDFNYIIAKIKVGGKTYFLDATDKNLPFGVLPYRCLNGDARVMDFKNGSYWETIIPISITQEKTTMMLTLDDEGVVEGKMRVSHYGYDAINKRNVIKTKKEDKYIEYIEDINDELEIISYKNTNLNDIEKPLIEEFDLIIEGEGTIGDKYYLYPFIFDRLEENPFKLDTRQYPVDFGHPWKSDFALTMMIPEGYEVETMPKNKSMALPNKKGYFMFNTTIKNQKISLSFKFILDNPYFYSNEYAYLKELFKQMIIIQNEPIVLKRL